MDQPTIESRIADLERRVSELEKLSSPPESVNASEPESDSLWLLNAMPTLPQENQGSVAFGGEVRLGGEPYIYQWQRTTRYLLEESWEESLKRLAALAHPIRGEILKRLLESPATPNELVAEGIVSSTGTAYHHLGELLTTGWITKASGGRHHIRPSRVVPLMIAITAGEDH